MFVELSSYLKKEYSLKATDIPFVRHIGIEEKDSELPLSFNENILKKVEVHFKLKL